MTPRMDARMLRKTLLAMALVGLVSALTPAASAAEAAECSWNPSFTQPIEQAFPALHFHDGPVCYVHVHADEIIGNEPNCMWNPSFTGPLEQAVPGLHFHDGTVCYVEYHP